MQAVAQRVTSIIPAQPGYEAGHIWITRTVEIETATLQDLQYSLEPIIAWVITAEIDESGEPTPLQEVRAVGAFGDISGNYFVRLPSGLIKPGFDDSVRSFDAFQEMYLERQKERERATQKGVLRGSATRPPLAQSPIVHGITLSSRHDLADEIGVMTRMVDSVDPSLRPHVETLFCDSKAQACYTVFFKHGTPSALAEQILDQVEAASRGHNGIWVQGASVKERGPNWPGDQ